MLLFNLLMLRFPKFLKWVVRVMKASDSVVCSSESDSLPKKKMRDFHILTILAAGKKILEFSKYVHNFQSA